MKNKQSRTRSEEHRIKNKKRNEVKKKKQI